jgi:hypothetical protein
MEFFFCVCAVRLSRSKCINGDFKSCLFGDGVRTRFFKQQSSHPSKIYFMKGNVFENLPLLAMLKAGIGSVLHQISDYKWNDTVRTSSVQISSSGC